MEFLSKGPQHRRESESGVVMITVALWLTLLLGIAGFSVDLGSWYLNIDRAKKAADAASLAGAVYLPGDPTAAANAARQSLSSNGISASRIVAIAPIADHPELLRVDLRGTVQNHFLSFLGIKDFNFTRDGIAGYMAPITMGSSSNALGREPDAYSKWNSGVTNGSRQAFWLIQGSDYFSKQFGARWTMGYCPASAVAGCNSAKPVPTGNVDYDENGMSYTVHVDKGFGGVLSIDAFDGGHVNVGAHCDGENLAYVYAQTHNELYNPTNLDVCTGDDRLPSNSADPNAPSPSYKYAFESTGLDGGVVAGNCPPVSFKPFLGDGPSLMAELNDPSGNKTDPVNSFRKWVNICRVPVAATGNARTIRIRITASDHSLGANRFSLRAGFINGTTPDIAKNAHVQLAAEGRLSINNQFAEPNVAFSLAHLSPSAAGRDVHVELFDIADADKPVESLTIMPSADSTNNGSPLTKFACAHTPPNSSTSHEVNDCTIRNLKKADYNSRITMFDVHIPSGYSCDYMQSNGCWMLLKLNYTGANTLGDTSSWSVGEPEQPLRLYNKNRL